MNKQLLFTLVLPIHNVSSVYYTWNFSHVRSLLWILFFHFYKSKASIIKCTDAADACEKFWNTTVSRRAYRFSKIYHAISDSTFLGIIISSFCQAQEKAINFWDTHRVVQCELGKPVSLWFSLWDKSSLNISGHLLIFYIEKKKTKTHATFQLHVMTLVCDYSISLTEILPG